MTARSIKRRNAKRMTVYMRLTLWRICGGPSERIPGALALVVAPLTFRPDSAPSAQCRQRWPRVAPDTIRLLPGSGLCTSGSLAEEP